MSAGQCPMARRLINLEDLEYSLATDEKPSDGYLVVREAGTLQVAYTNSGWGVGAKTTSLEDQGRLASDRRRQIIQTTDSDRLTQNEADSGRPIIDSGVWLASQWPIHTGVSSVA